MGNCVQCVTANRTPNDSISEERNLVNEDENAYILHLIDSSNVPIKGVDVLDGIQAYCKIKVKTAEGDRKTSNSPFTECKTSIRDSCENPSWNSYRKIIAYKNDIIHIELYDEDWFLDDYLGEATIPITADLKFGEIMQLPFEMKHDKFKDCGSSIRVKIHKESALSVKDKQIYFIRHGESEFNQALEKRDLVGMWSKTDHPLTEKGISQCETLNGKIKTAAVDAEDKEVQDFLAADGIWTSPLCRAAQTAFIALKEHPTLRKTGILLASNCREFKSIGGRDCSSSALGADIKERCLDKLKKHRDNEFVQQYSNVAWDFNDCGSKWWSGGVHDKSDKEINERFNDFVNFLRYRPEENIVLVSHSVFIRYFFKRYLPQKDGAYHDVIYNEKYEADFVDDDAEDDDVVEQEQVDNFDGDDFCKLSTWKLENGGCIRVDLKFDDSYRDGVLVKDTKLMFESQLKKRGRRRPQNNEQ